MLVKSWSAQVIPSCKVIYKVIAYQVVFPLLYVFLIDKHLNFSNLRMSVFGNKNLQSAKTDKASASDFYILMSQDCGMAWIIFITIPDFINNGGSIDFVLFGSSSLGKSSRIPSCNGFWINSFEDLVFLKF